jgi:hypothetical protein
LRVESAQRCEHALEVRTSAFLRRRFRSADLVQSEADFFSRERRAPSAIALLATAAADGRLGEASRKAASSNTRPARGLVASDSGLFTSDRVRPTSHRIRVKGPGPAHLRVAPNVEAVARSRSPNHVLPI